MSEQPLWERYKDQLEALGQRKLNFDIERRDEYTAANGWHIDDYQTELPSEAPGPPSERGPWSIARRMLLEYRFPDPSIITGIFVPDTPIDKRVMLLRARYLWMTFYFGVRVGAVIDECRAGDKGPEQVWGFNYQTLEGHLERGQMDFTVIKWLESGQVGFRIHAFSRAAESANLLIRFGFWLFGRRVQLRFAKNALARMRRLVDEELKAGPAQKGDAHSSSPPIQPAGADPVAAERIEQVQQ